MVAKTACVIDENSFYKDFVIIGEDKNPVFYKLKDEERVLINRAPALKVFSGFPGFVKPKWNGETWIEGATADELRLFDEAHPAFSRETQPTEQEQLRADVDYLLMMQEG